MKLMGWESKVSYYQMLSCFCLFSWMVPFSLFLLFLVIGFGFLSLLFTSLALILSTLVYKWKHKTVNESPEEKSSLEKEKIAPISVIMNESLIEEKSRQEEEQASDDVANAIAYDSDQLLSTSEDSELDGSISDEDSLIEIALPTGHCSLQKNKKGLLLSDESLFNQESLMELLAEFNDMYEEENFIEIDISMGSIKCSRFQIQA